ncbi:PEP/pyruvate-binding domain-containing protein [Tahibacter amnicola]|uniref:PEP-utilizing enzyme n=1 Tax=Tahibacter amnicola TaxID=2976241 RepID=A0ABY6BNQ2_9GAMM|nr:PEP/pyruvate-binding domain-containing protein [Tahibacter amnicola]UXI70685.1 PEP-utilizing enzyme [Tahibacter amnicola]
MLSEFGIPVPPGFVVDSAALAGRHRGEVLNEALVASLVDALDVRGWNDVPLAVRSSAASEDSTRTSFAGVYKTHLHVRGMPDLVHAVQAVLDSYWSPAAAAYRERFGLSDETARMAIIVMPMLAPVASGVAFTCDPVAGREDQLIIHANWGLGDSLVGGLAEADEYRLQVGYPQENLSLVGQTCGSKARMTVPRAGGGTELADTPDHLVSRAALSAAQAIELGELVRELATTLDYSRPFYDVEWVWDGERFWIVQARPITVRNRQTYAALKTQPTVWSRGNSRDVVPDPLPALDRSVSLPLINHMLTRSAARAGYATLPGVQRTATHHGRVYFETSILQWESFDGFGVPPKVYNRLLGGHQPEITVPEPTLGDRVRRAWHGMRFLQACVRPRLQARAILAAAHQAAANHLEQPLPGNPRELAERLRARVMATRTNDDLLLLQAAGSAMLVLLDLLEGHFPGEGGARAASLMSGGEPSVTAAQGHALVQLAQIAAADPVALAWLQSPQRDGREWRQRLGRDSAFGHGLEAFLQRYGHRAVYESYLQHPRWREDPGFILDAVASLIDGGVEPGRESVSNGNAARERVLAQLPIWDRPLVPWLVKMAIAERNMREGARSALTAQLGVMRRIVTALADQCVAAGHLESANDVFHLTWMELQALAEGRLAAQHAMQRVRLRRRQFAAFAAADAPDVILESGGSLSASRPAARTATPGAEEWQGVVVASGFAKGAAVLAHHPGEALNLAAGSVLVAPATDPSWTPAFFKASAIVMETGGYLSHGAIVARELGIPAVANVPGILGALKSGDDLEVDANQGLVRRVAPGS